MNSYKHSKSEVNTAIAYTNATPALLNNIKIICKRSQLTLPAGIVYKEFAQTGHFIFDYNRHTVISHTNLFFKNFLLNFTATNNKSIKIFNFKNSTIAFIFEGNKNNFKSQSFQSEGIFDIFSSFATYLAIFKSAISKIDDDNFKAWMLDLASCLIDFTAPAINMTRIFSCFLKVISLIIRYCYFVKNEKLKVQEKGFFKSMFTSESFGDICFVLAGFGISPELISKITLFQKLVTLKISSLDFLTESLYNFFSIIINLLNELYKRFNLPFLLSFKLFLENNFSFITNLTTTKIN